MLKIVAIIDNKIASPLSPTEFVKRYCFPESSVFTVLDLKVEQGELADFRKTDGFGFASKKSHPAKNKEGL